MATFDSKPFYAVRCDWPECPNRDDEGEYTWWGEESDAISAALDGDWRIEDTYPEENARLFCPEHGALPYAHWLSDDDREESETEDDALVVTLPSGEVVALRTP